MKKWIYNVLFILCVAVVVYAALKIYNQKEEYKKAETEYEQLQKKEKNIDFGELKKLNKDIVAWIKIPGTRINYPIVQWSDEMMQEEVRDLEKADEDERENRADAYMGI